MNSHRYDVSVKEIDISNFEIVDVETCSLVMDVVMSPSVPILMTEEDFFKYFEVFGRNDFNLT